VDGVLVIDKPQGLTSHDVVAVARRCLGETRIGHTGTLDPHATGVLPLACGQATRLVRFLIASDKDYEARVRFGLTTDSYDVTGRETSRSGRVPARDEIEAAVGRLRGEYLQTPPPYSAKKVVGRRAYALARAEQQVTLTPVPVQVTRAELMDVEGPLATVALSCSAGFYVRAFAQALGEMTGTGACLDALRRTRSGQFGLAQAIPLRALQEGGDGRRALIPLEQLLPAMASARLTGEGRDRVAHGRDLEPAHVESAEGLEGADWVRLFDRDRLIALGRAQARTGTLHPSVVLI
jgi:tRNA pseudouridine55 synthase